MNSLLDKTDIGFGMEAQGLFLVSSTVILLIIIFFLYKTYRTSINVEAKLAEFSSLTNNRFGRKMHLIEVNADEYKLNKALLGPLARIIDEYCVLTTDRHGTITFANGKFLALSGHSFSRLIGQNESFNHPDDDSLPVMQCDQALSGVWNGEVCNRHADGSRYWMNMFLFPLSYISDEDDGYIYFGTDITDIKTENNQLMQEVKDKSQKLNQVESLLLHSEKMASLGTISAGIAHEINNPIAFVSSNLNRSRDYLGTMAGIIQGLQKRISEEKFQQFLDAETNLNVDARKLTFMMADYPALMDETDEGIERIKKIIRDLKHFSHNQPEAFSPTDIATCMAMSLNLAKHELKNRITVSHSLPDSMPLINGSESQLSQVFMNVFVNAAQAIEGKGNITIAGHCDEQWCTLTITDDGPGIAEDTLKQIFEPFYTTKPIGQGTGLGLSISHDIIQHHGGTMTVESQLGAGTTFTIRLPLKQTDRADAA
ncbi:PAS domain-containing sensor histidine kinase [Alcanivorax sp. HI0083]|uniref:PAS domain-containing sensor histidine kinase n=2 Tax=Alcanivorax TaxID=59753 RepID=UPI0007B7AC54|nr:MULTISPECIES: ATP-binding protein [unclassified Alcanivorax]KZY36238.1 PAS domain-containing sensor histidine kinase [Alcanivorax sp. HI0044]KZZ28749.1 PAS domain-containing sensor histidine kinase [Alcanivorax sp. HI0083]